MIKPAIIKFAAILLIIAGEVSAQSNRTVVFRKDTITNPGKSLVLYAGPYRGNITWQSSADRYAWKDIRDTGPDSLILNIDSSAYYRFRVVEGSCDPVYSEVTQVYVSDSCAFNPSMFVGQYITVLEHWNNNSGNSYYTVKVSRNADLSSESKMVLDITGLFTTNKSSQYRISVDMETQLISTAPEDEMVVDSDLNDWGFGRLWFQEFTAPFISTCGKYLRFTVTPYLNDTGLWFNSSITYFIGPGAVNIRYDKDPAEDGVSKRDFVQPVK